MSKSGDIDTGPGQRRESLAGIATGAQKSQDAIIRCFSRLVSNPNEQIGIRLFAGLFLVVGFCLIALIILVVLYVTLHSINPSASFMPVWIIFGLLCLLAICVVIFIPALARANKDLEVSLEERRMEKIARKKKLVTT